MKTDPALSLVVQTLRTASTLVRESRRLFRPHGLTAAQFNVLNILAGAPEGLSQTELGGILVVDRSNVTGLIDRMERAGWVRRADVPGDRRSYRVRLTAGGRRLWERAQADYDRAVRAAVSQMGEARASAGLDALRRLDAAAKAIGSELEGR